MDILLIQTSSWLTSCPPDWLDQLVSYFVPHFKWSRKEAIHLFFYRFFLKTSLKSSLKLYAVLIALWPTCQTLHLRLSLDGTVDRKFVKTEFGQFAYGNHSRMFCFRSIVSILGWNGLNFKLVDQSRMVLNYLVNYFFGITSFFP